MARRLYRGKLGGGGGWGGVWGGYYFRRIGENEVLARMLILRKLTPNCALVNRHAVERDNTL